MKHLKIFREQDQQSIQIKLDDAFRKISNKLLLSEIKNIVKSPFSKRLMKNTIAIITANECLSKSYKYHKDVGCVKLIHDGKSWLFDSAFRNICYAGNSTGGINYIFPVNNKNEIINNVLSINNYSFSN